MNERANTEKYSFRFYLAGTEFVFDKRKNVLLGAVMISACLAFFLSVQGKVLLITNTEFQKSARLDAGHSDRGRQFLLLVIGIIVWIQTLKMSVCQPTSSQHRLIWNTLPLSLLHNCAFVAPKGICPNVCSLFCFALWSKRTHQLCVFWSQKRSLFTEVGFAFHVNSLILHLCWQI